VAGERIWWKSQRELERAAGYIAGRAGGCGRVAGSPRRVRDAGCFHVVFWWDGAVDSAGGAPARKGACTCRAPLPPPVGVLPVGTGIPPAPAALLASRDVTTWLAD
jgi:hypothetical protein